MRGHPRKPRKPRSKRTENRIGIEVEVLCIRSKSRMRSRGANQASVKEKIRPEEAKPRSSLAHRGTGKHVNENSARRC